MVTSEFPSAGIAGLLNAATEPGAGLALPVLLATLERGRIVDVRVVTREFLLANLAGDALIESGGKTCKGNAGDCRSRSG
jgi:hypothetical protein